MSKKIAMIPVICPLYRLFVWKKMNLIEEFQFDFYFESTNNLNNIKYIPKSVLDESFTWHKITNRYSKGICWWQSGVLKTAFSSYDAIIISGNVRCLSTWLTGLVARLMGKKIYFWSHGVYGKENRFILFLKKIFFAIPNGNFFYGNRAVEKVLEWGFSKSKNHVIYNSLDYDFHKSTRKQIGVSNIYKQHFQNENSVIMFIGRLTAQKKLHLLLEAVKKIENQKINLVFIGDGTEKLKLEEQAMELGLKTWFYGECYDETELASLIYNADICVSPGNVGLTLIHCLSYGTPVITHDDFSFQMPEAEAITPKKTGDFFKRDSVLDLSEVIVNWLNNSPDKNEIRENCYKTIDEKYNPYFQTELIKTILKRDLKII